MLVKSGKLKRTKGLNELEFIYEYFSEFSMRAKADCFFFSIFIENDGIDPMFRFSFILRQMENGTDLKVIDLFANKYEGYGLSRAIILESKKLFNKRIISSSNTFPSFNGESNWEDSITKVWNPLVKDNLAKYNSKFDQYELL